MNSSRSNMPKKNLLMRCALRLLPAHSQRGQIARNLFRSIKRISKIEKANIHSDTQRLAEIEKQIESLNCDILVQVDNFEAGGLENVVFDLNGTLASEGYQIVLLVLGNQGPAAQKAKDSGVSVLAFPYSEASYSAMLDKLAPKLVMAHYSFDGPHLCNQRSIPFIQIIHNAYMWFDDHQHQKFTKAAADTTVFVAVSEYAKSYSVARLSIEEHKCIVIVNGIDFKPFEEIDAQKTRNQLRAQHKISDDTFLFLDLGAINHQKNHLGTLRAFNIVQKNHTKAHMAILGPVYEQELLTELNEYISTHHLNEKVSYYGAVSGAHAYLAMADAFATGTFFEGGQLSLLEAIRANLPIVTSEVGLASYFRGKAGFQVVPPAVDLIQYHGKIWEMASTPEFEQRFATAMIETLNNPLRPDFSEEQLKILEKNHAYEKYKKLISMLLSRETVTPAHFDNKWIE